MPSGIGQDKSMPSNATRRTLLIWAGLLFVSGLAGFFLLWGMVDRGDGWVLADQPFWSWSLATRVPILTGVLGVITTLANPLWFTVIVIVVSLAWGFVRKEVWRPLLLALSMGLVALTSTFVKLAIGRPRPPAGDMLFGVSTSYAFPSGHALAAGVFFIGLAYLLISRRTGWRPWVLWCSVAVLGVFSVSYSRLYLGHHWLTDVLAGISLSFSIVALLLVADAFKPMRAAAPSPESSTPVVASKAPQPSPEGTPSQH